MDFAHRLDVLLPAAYISVICSAPSILAYVSCLSVRVVIDLSCQVPEPNVLFILVKTAPHSSYSNLICSLKRSRLRWANRIIPECTVTLKLN